MEVQLFVDFKKTCDSLYSFLIQFEVPVKMVRLIKMYLKETYSKVRIGKHLSDMLLQLVLDFFFLVLFTSTMQLC
jgi:hypothetical protein